MLDIACGTGIAFAAFIAAVGSAAEALVEDHRDGNHVVVPMHANVAVARPSARTDDGDREGRDG